MDHEFCSPVVREITPNSQPPVTERPDLPPIAGASPELDEPDYSIPIDVFAKSLIGPIRRTVSIRRKDDRR